MAFKESGYLNIFGVDTNKDTLEKAKALGIIKEGYTNSEDIIPKADLIVLAVYPELVKKFIKNNISLFKSGLIITDVTGIKEPFIEEINEMLPDNIDFVFGYPMAGREKKGIDYATSQVFKGANYLITVTPKNSKKNIELIEKIAYEMGFKNIKKVSPKYHDEMISYTSQLPNALAVALINSDIEGRDTGKFVGDSYKELTRIANINETLWSELFLGNKKNLLNSINNFQDELNNIKKCLEDADKESLEKLFIKSTKK